MSVRDLGRLFKPLVPRALYESLADFYSRHQLVRVPGPRVSYNQLGMATTHSAAFAEAPGAAAAFAAASAADPKLAAALPRMAWQTHVLAWAGWVGSRLDGDFVECGVNRGYHSIAVMKLLSFEKLPKTFWLLDTYRGLDASLFTEAERRAGFTGGGYEECYDAVVKTFAPYPNVKIVRGAVPGTLSEVKSDKIAYLSLDMNAATPEIEAMKFFWPKMSPGAMAVLDDYNWVNRPEQRRAFDEWAGSEKVAILSLPTGQGLVVKPGR